MQDSNAATTATGAGGRREPGINQSTTAQVSSIAGVTPPHLPLALFHHSPSSLLHLSSAPVYGPVLRKRLRSEDSRQPFSFFPDTRCRQAVTRTCAPLPSTHLLTLITLTFVLFALTLALLSEFADDQTSRLAKPSPIRVLLLRYNE
jgi:hypothetical protein